MAEKLKKAFYLRENVLQISKELLGMHLVTEFDGIKTSGIITETEAYTGPEDKASHAYGWRRTKRTETMYQAGGVAYVYLCYGMYHLFNVVVGSKDWPAAILIRSIEPVDGIPYMLHRCHKNKESPKLTNGPGKLTKALGIGKAENGEHLIVSETVWIEKRTKTLSEENISASPRIGVDYAAEDALLPYRFTIKGHPFVSK